MDLHLLPAHIILILCCSFLVVFLYLVLSCLVVTLVFSTYVIKCRLSMYNYLDFIPIRKLQKQINSM